MTAFKVDKFGGMLPAWDDTILPDMQAADALNTYLPSGAVIGWRKPKLLHTLSNPAAKRVYRVPKITGENQLADTTITAADSVWLEFEDKETDVMRGPVVNDTHGRYYFASPSVRPKYNTYDRITQGLPHFLLGVPGAECPPGVVVDGGGETSQVGNPERPEGATDGYVVPGNSLYLIPVKSTTTLRIPSVNFMPSATDDDVHYVGVVYSDVEGSPTSLMSVGTVETGVTLDVEAVANFQNPITLTADVQYWIGIMVDGDISIYVANSEVSVAYVTGNTFGNGPPETLSPEGTPVPGQAPAPNIFAMVPPNIGYNANGTAGPNLQLWGTLDTAAVFEARAYVYTWVSEYGEEGPPCPPTIVNGWSNAVWTIETFCPSVSDMGVDRNLKTKRIYRTISAIGGETNYFFVAEIDINEGIYVDKETDDIIALNNQLASTDWFGPPEDLQGMVGLPNGMAAGFRRNEVWLAEPFQPHAWPPRYVMTTEFPIVGLGVIGQALVIATKGTPAIAMGVSPAQMTLAKVLVPEPCISRGSIVSSDVGVLYMSNNGLIQVTQYGQAANITELWITRERWAELLPLKNIRAVKHSGSYFAFGTVSGSDTSVAQQGFTIELTNQDKESFTLYPQVGGHRIGFSRLSSPWEVDIDNVDVDPWTGVCLLVQNGGIYYYDFTDPEPTIVPYKWRSKIYQQRSKHNFAVVRVFFDVPPGSPELSDERNTDAVQTLADDQYLIVRTYAELDGEMTLVTTRECRKSGELLRILSGFKTEFWQWEIEGRVRVSNFQVATSVKELSGV